MTGKNSSLANKFIIQLTPKYRIRIDSMNSTLMKRKTKSNATEAVDEEVDNGYMPLGYYGTTKPEHLVRGLLVDHVVGEGSRNHLKLQEFLTIFESNCDKLVSLISKDMNVANGFTKTINTQSNKIDELQNTIRIMKGQITKLKRKK